MQEKEFENEEVKIRRVAGMEALQDRAMPAVPSWQALLLCLSRTLIVVWDHNVNSVEE